MGMVCALRFQYVLSGNVTAEAVGDFCYFGTVVALFTQGVRRAGLHYRGPTG